MNPQIEDLTREKSIWAVFVAARNIRAPIWQCALYLIAFAGTAAYVLLTQSEVSAMAVSLRSFLKLAFNTGVALLGFLLAGFTFFASFGDKSLFLHAAQHPHDKFKEMSWLKYFMFAFIKTLCFYFIFVLLIFLTMLVCSPNGPLSEILSHLPDIHEPWAKRIIVSVGYVVFIPWAVFLIAALSSFIYNVYHVTMLSIQWEWAAQVRNHDKGTDSEEQDSGFSMDQH